MAASRPHLPHPPPAVEFRAAIEAAIRDGVPLERMTLLLTVGDAARLRRDRTLAIEDIAYSGEGGMHFLGVQVVSGGVARSSLQRTPVDEAMAGG